MRYAYQSIEAILYTKIPNQKFKLSTKHVNYLYILLKEKTLRKLLNQNELFYYELFLLFTICYSSVYKFNKESFCRKLNLTF